jgi:hypothetical protein
MTVKSRTSKRTQAAPEAVSQVVSEAGAPPVAAEMSAQARDEMKQAAELQIDEFMKTVGYANTAERTDDAGWRWFHFGSADGRAGVVESNGDLYLRAEALIMPLPSDMNVLFQLMHTLLAANMTIPGYARLGIANGAVLVSATKAVLDLAAGDVPICITSVMATADHLGGPLSEQFGGPSSDGDLPEAPAKSAPRSRKKSPKAQE